MIEPEGRPATPTDGDDGPAVQRGLEVPDGDDDRAAVGWSRVRTPGEPGSVAGNAGRDDSRHPEAGAGPTGAPRSSRAPALWLVLAGVAIATLLAVLLDSAVGVGVLAGTLATAGVARTVLPEPGPEGITIRSRGVDVFFFFAGAVALVFLALVAPDV